MTEAAAAIEPDDDVVRGADDDEPASDPAPAPEPPPPPPPKKRNRATSPRAQALNERAERRASAENGARDPAAPPARTIEDVAARHREEDDDRDDDPAWTPQSDVPPLEPDPRRRRRPTMLSEVESAEGADLPDTAGRGPPKNLTDVSQLYFSAFPTGQVFIRVERLEPKISKGARTAGYLGRIWHPVTEDDFQARFGGGVYQMQVYGPDPRGKRDPYTGHPIIKPLTKPFQQNFWGDPVIDSEFDQDGDSMTMRDFYDPAQRRGAPPQPPFPRRPPPPTSADAQIHGQALKFAETTLLEERKENRELRQQLSRGPGDAGAVLTPVLNVVQEQGKQTVDALREESSRTKEHYERELGRRDEEMKELRAELNRLRDRPSDSSNAFGMMSEIAKVIAPGRTSSEELERIHGAHRDEMRRADETHKRELDAQRQSYEDRIKTVNENLEHERRRGREELADLRRTLEDREGRTRADAETRLRDEKERHAAAITTVHEQHKTELERQKQQFELVRETDKVAHKAELAAQKERIETLRDDLSRARAEADDKDDFETQINKIERGAKALGFQRAEDAAPKDWKDHLARSLGETLRNADKIVKNVADTFRARAEAIEATERQAERRLPDRQQRQQQQEGAPRRAVRQPIPRREVWASDDMPLAGQDRAPPTPATSAPPFQPAQAAPSRPVAPDAQPAPAPPAAQPPAQAAAAPQPTPPANGAAAASGIDPDQLELFRMWAEQEIDAGSDPGDFAQRFFNQIGLGPATEVVTRVRAQQIIEALAQTPATAGSPIVRRDGQRWLEAVWEHLKRLVRSGGNHEEQQQA